VTTVVATRNRWPDLQWSLAHHSQPTILVDNGSTDGTPDLVREHFPAVDVVALGRNLGAQARNVGAARATTPYVAFADDDSWWAPGALSEAAVLLDCWPRLALVAARTLVGPEEREDPVCAVMDGSGLPWEDDLPGRSVLGFLACAAVVRREAFLAVGGFDDVIFFGGEEERVALDLAAAGWGLAYVPEVVAHHCPSGSRNASQRQVLAARNRVLTALLRRPWPVVAETAARVARQGPTGRRGLVSALARAPRAVANRRTLPEGVEAAKRWLDAPEDMRQVAEETCATSPR
jgi:GT2 family glycosyltransferase